MKSEISEPVGTRKKPANPCVRKLHCKEFKMENAGRVKVYSEDHHQGGRLELHPWDNSYRLSFTVEFNRCTTVSIQSQYLQHAAHSDRKEI